MNNQTTVDTPNNDGTVTRVITNIITITYTSDEYQALIDNISAQITTLQTAVTNATTILSQVSNIKPLPPQPEPQQLA